MKIAVVYSTRAILGERATGSGTYEVGFKKILEEAFRGSNYEMVAIVPRKNKVGLFSKVCRSKPFYSYRLSFWEAVRVQSQIPAFTLHFLFGSKSGFENRLRRMGFEAVIFVGPSKLAILLSRTPFIFTMWDLGHRELIGFEEAWRLDEWLRREALYRVCLPRASFILVDSNDTGAKLERFYGVSSERWGRLGLIVSTPEDAACIPHVDGQFLIYPAAHWPHKNHMTLIRAFDKVLATFPQAKLVFCGKNSSFTKDLLREANRLGIQDSVVDFGELDSPEVAGLIKNACALVMPSLLGPTNYPPLEALLLGTPAIVSDRHNFGQEINSYLKFVAALDEDAWSSAIVESLLNPKRVECRSLGSYEDAVSVLTFGVSSIGEPSQASEPQTRG